MSDTLELTAVFCEDYTISVSIFQAFVPCINKLIKNDRFPRVGEQIAVPGFNPEKIINVCHNTNWKMEGGPELLIHEFQLDFPNFTVTSYYDAFGKYFREDMPEKYIIRPGGAGYRALLKSYYDLAGEIIAIELEDDKFNKLSFGGLDSRKDFKEFEELVDKAKI